MADKLRVKKTESIFNEIERMRERITQRAYELFERGGCTPGRDLDDWLAAERELVWAPPVEIEEEGKELTVKVSAPGIEAKDLAVEVTPEDLLVEGEVNHERRKSENEVHRCEMTSAKLFRAIHFPKRIDPASAKAELKNGMLKITARVVEEASARKLGIAAA